MDCYVPRTIFQVGAAKTAYVRLRNPCHPDRSPTSQQSSGPANVFAPAPRVRSRTCRASGHRSPARPNVGGGHPGKACCGGVAEDRRGERAREFLGHASPFQDARSRPIPHTRLRPEDVGRFRQSSTLASVTKSYSIADDLCDHPGRVDGRAVAYPDDVAVGADQHKSRFIGFAAVGQTIAHNFQRHAE